MFRFPHSMNTLCNITATHNFQVFPGFSRSISSVFVLEILSKSHACVCWGNNVIADRKKIAHNWNDLYRSKVRMEVIKVKISDPKTSTKRADVKNQYLLDLFGQRVTWNKKKANQLLCAVCKIVTVLYVQNGYVCMFHKMYVSSSTEREWKRSRKWYLFFRLRAHFPSHCNRW